MKIKIYQEMIQQLRKKKIKKIKKMKRMIKKKLKKIIRKMKSKKTKNKNKKKIIESKDQSINQEKEKEKETKTTNGDGDKNLEITNNSQKNAMGYVGRRNQNRTRTSESSENKGDTGSNENTPSKRLKQRYLKRESIIQVSNEKVVQGPHAEDKQLLFKLVLIGDAGVGKTNLLSRYTVNQFHLKSKSTIGVEFGARQLVMGDGQRVKVNVWDTAGQEQYRSITRSYYRKAHGGLVVFDYSMPRTLSSINEWITSIRENTTGHLELILVGNKSDLMVKKMKLLIM